MLQKELVKRLKARYDTKMDGSGRLEVSSDGIPLCRIKYNAGEVVKDLSAGAGVIQLSAGVRTAARRAPARSPPLW